MDFFLWRAEFFKIDKRDFTFIRAMRAHLQIVHKFDIPKLQIHFLINKPLVMESAYIYDVNWQIIQ